MNIPNQLTLLRIILTACMVAVLAFQISPWWHWVSLLIFVLASVTDFLDGFLARKLNLMTSFGALMDPLADKFLICSAFIFFVELHLVPAWSIVIIVTRELAVTGLRVLAASKNKTLAADHLGKLKTSLQIAAVILIFLQISIIHTFPDFTSPLITTVPITIFHAAVLATLISAVSYLYKNKRLYLNEC